MAVTAAAPWSQSVGIAVQDLDDAPILHLLPHEGLNIAELQIILPVKAQRLATEVCQCLRGAAGFPGVVRQRVADVRNDFANLRHRVVLCGTLNDGFRF